MTRRKKILKTTVIFLVVFLVVFSVASFIFIKMNFDNVFARTAPKEYSAYLLYEDVSEQYDRELLSFMSGANRLQGYLYGAGNSKGLVVISHGLGGGAESYLSETLYFVDNGYQVFAYDNTGCHRSEGEDCIGLSQSVIDLDAALTYIESETRFADIPVFLFGHSWGGYAVTAILNYDHNITATASVAGFNRPMEMIVEWTRDSLGNFIYAEYPYVYIYQKLLFGKNANMSAVDGINSTDTPVLIIHGANDETIGYNSAGIIAYSDEITNPNVSYKTCDVAKQDGHTNLFYSLDALTYLEEIDVEYNKLWDEYNENIPKDIDMEFFEKIDKYKMSGVNEDLMQAVVDFYGTAAE